MKKWFALVLALVLCLALCGCSYESRLVGTWTGNGFDLLGMELEAETAEKLIFRKDGTVELVLPNGKSWTCEYAATDDTLTLRGVSGDFSLGVRYTLVGDTLTIAPNGDDPGTFIRN